MTTTSPPRGSGSSPSRRLARPERFRLALRDDDSGATPIELPPQRGMRWVGLVFAAMFAVFAGVLVIQISTLGVRGTRDVFDLGMMLFNAFWILGWSVGVLILGALTVLFLFYGESARIAGGRLVMVPRLGPLKFVTEFDLARVRALRIESAGGDDARVRFDYGAGTRRIGDAMPRAEAERIVSLIRAAAPASATRAAEPAPDAPPPAGALAGSAPRQPSPRPAGSPAPQSSGPPAEAAGGRSAAALLALLAANLIPLGGVLFAGWNLGDVMVLFWAESAIVGLYTLAKMAVVDKWAALFSGVFFTGHFGGFMAIHFVFIYTLFVRGLGAKGAEPDALDALWAIFVPLWPALAALAVSHGVSFAGNFIGRREYIGAATSHLMSAPYRRIMLMHVTIIFGGWLVMALDSAVPALALLVGLKIAADLIAHQREHPAAPQTAPGAPKS